MPTTPRRTNFYMTKREKNKFKIKTIKTSHSYQREKIKIQTFERIACGIQSKPSGINAHQTCSCPKTRKSTHRDYGKKYIKKTLTDTNENIQSWRKKLS